MLYKWHYPGIMTFRMDCDIDKLKMLIIFVLLVSSLGTIKAQDDTTPPSDSGGTKKESLETETTLSTESNTTTTESSGIKNETMETGKANVTNLNESSSTPAMEKPEKVAEPNSKESQEASKEVNTTEISTTTDFMDLMTYMQYDNAGDPYARPGKHLHGPRHIRAHDGFHNLKREKYWAHWNDAFTTTKQPKQT
ncbi:uncharacterized protein [Drosophila tropicalis]|uniref:uncharacterized protein n=1 Tax=Drosophila tropicalis TaxID=46794 RepID=UPI0035ABF058